MIISKRVVFPGAAGQDLSGRLELPVDGEPRGYAVFAHCFTCSKDLSAAVNISRALGREGIAVLRFDFTGLGESEGDFAGTAFSSNVEDLEAAAAFLEREHRAPEVLIGHSLGGAAVLRAAERIPSAKAIVTIGAPASPAHVARLLTDAREEIETDGEAEVMIDNRRFRIRKEFLSDLEAHPMQEVIRRLRRPLLIMHAPRDNVVGVENAAEIFHAALHPKSFISLDEADHLLSDERDSRYAGGVIAAWASRYLEPPAAPTRDELLAGDQVVVRTGRDRYRTEVRAKRHALVADEPVSVGGTDLGPTPYQLLSAALGTCTSITLRMYADRKGWPLDSVSVRLNHSRLHAADSEECPTRSPRMDQIERIIEMDGPLTDEQRERLLEIADRCPVHRTLEAGVKVLTSAAGPTA